jgi:hypothetical protein
MSECIALAKAHEEETGWQPPVLDPEFAKDVIHYRDHSGFAVIDFKKF